MKKAVGATVLVVLLLATSAFAGDFNQGLSGGKFVVSCARVQAIATALIGYISASTSIPDSLKPVLIKAVQDAAARTPCK
jgi:hypothetical protein